MITNFPANPKQNLGGLSSFQFVPAFQVITFPQVINNALITALTLFTGKTWLNGYATHESLRFRETVKDSEQGDVFEQLITGFMPGDSHELKTLIAEMEQVKKFFVIVNDRSLKKLVGYPLEPLEFSADFDSGGQRSDAKGYNFKFAGRSVFRAPKYL